MSLRYFKQRVFLKIESAFVETQVVAKHDFATHKINVSAKHNLESVIGWGIFKGEGGFRVQTKSNPFYANSNPSPLKKKNKKHSKILKNRDTCCVEYDKVVESI